MGGVVKTLRRSNSLSHSIFSPTGSTGAVPFGELSLAFGEQHGHGHVAQCSPGDSYFSGVATASRPSPPPPRNKKKPRKVAFPLPS